MSKVKQRGIVAPAGRTTARGRADAKPVGKAATGKAAGSAKTPKKAAGKAARTTVKAAPAKSATVPRTARPAASTKVAAAGRTKAGKTAATLLKGGRGSKAALKLPPVRSIRIRALDPLSKCGPGTSVQLLYRVDELLDGSPRAHLVFFDRHGWYCEHGRNCPAVADVRKHGRNHSLFTD